MLSLESGHLITPITRFVIRRSWVRGRRILLSAWSVSHSCVQAMEQCFSNISSFLQLPQRAVSSVLQWNWVFAALWLWTKQSQVGGGPHTPETGSSCFPFGLGLACLMPGEACCCGSSFPNAQKGSSLMNIHHILPPGQWCSTAALHGNSLTVPAKPRTNRPTLFKEFEHRNPV